LDAAPAHVHFSTFFEPDVMVRCLDSLPPVHLAAWAGDVAIVHELLLAGANPQRKAAGARGSFNAVTFAAMGGHLTVVEMLLQPHTAGTMLLCVVWCGAVWCGVVWCGVVWCGVVWRENSPPFAFLTSLFLIALSTVQGPR
jgi:hypothetical protein